MTATQTATAKPLTVLDVWDEIKAHRPAGLRKAQRTAWNRAAADAWRKGLPIPGTDVVVPGAPAKASKA
jgi:hypothetical protein